MPSRYVPAPANLRQGSQPGQDGTAASVRNSRLVPLYSIPDPLEELIRQREDLQNQWDELQGIKSGPDARMWTDLEIQRATSLAEQLSEIRSRIAALNVRPTPAPAVPPVTAPSPAVPAPAPPGVPDPLRQTGIGLNPVSGWERLPNGEWVFHGNPNPPPDTIVTKPATPAPNPPALSTPPDFSAELAQLKTLLGQNNVPLFEAAQLANGSLTPDEVRKVAADRGYSLPPAPSGGVPHLAAPPYNPPPPNSPNPQPGQPGGEPPFNLPPNTLTPDQQKIFNSATKAGLPDQQARAVGEYFSWNKRQVADYVRRWQAAGGRPGVTPPAQSPEDVAKQAKDAQDAAQDAAEAAQLDAAIEAMSRLAKTPIKSDDPAIQADLQVAADQAGVTIEALRIAARRDPKLLGVLVETAINARDNQVKLRDVLELRRIEKEVRDAKTAVDKQKAADDWQQFTLERADKLAALQETAKKNETERGHLDRLLKIDEQNATKFKQSQTPVLEDTIRQAEGQLNAWYIHAPKFNILAAGQTAAWAREMVNVPAPTLPVGLSQDANGNITITQGPSDDPRLQALIPLYRTASHMWIAQQKVATSKLQDEANDKEAARKKAEKEAELKAAHDQVLEDIRTGNIGSVEASTILLHKAQIANQQAQQASFELSKKQFASSIIAMLLGNPQAYYQAGLNGLLDQLSSLAGISIPPFAGALGPAPISPAVRQVTRR